MSREYFDLIVFIPLEEELREFEKEFPLQADKSTDIEFRYTVDSGEADTSILVVLQEGMGREHARTAVASALRDYDLGLVVCLGIAGALSGDVVLGDVVYSGNIVDVSDNAKAIDLETGNMTLQWSPTHYSTPKKITQSFNFTRIMPELRGIYSTWQKQGESLAKDIFTGVFKGRHGRDESFGQPKALNGAIACGIVTKSEAYREKLLDIDRKMLAIETESGGVFSEASFHNVPAITVRGISDYADSGKTELEDQTKGKARQIAALNATSFLKLQLQSGSMKKILSDYRELHDAPNTSLFDTKPTPIEQLSLILEELEQETAEKLRELSPEYRLQPEGYRLPIPRVRPADNEPAISKVTQPATSIEVRDALEDHRILRFNVPLTYPDQSLPWVVAHDLMTAEIDGEQAVPIVIDGGAVRPPKFDLEAVAGRSLSHLMQRAGVRLIIIIENIPFGSKTRLKYLLEEVKKYSEAKVIFIVKDDANIVRESEFTQSLPVYTYNIAEVSFLEIAEFIQKNFKMSGSEADVIALRLNDTFEKFNLSAHPTYFAGIPKESLAKLLQANRRAELIQLAVDGFLTFVVAEDKDDITLSRTTRSRFLRKLVVLQKVEKRSFNHEQVVALARGFSKEYDFAIDPIAFIQAFVDKGILHFEGDLVRISLPFMESYLLAIELAANQELAESYFIIDDDLFDLITFDIYAELGVSEGFIGRLMSRLENHIADLSELGDKPHIMLSNDVYTRFSGSPKKLEAIRERLARAFDEVQESQGDKERKQRLLDMAARVREIASKRAEQDAGDPEDASALTDKIGPPVQSWAIGGILLGSGAEHLNAETKRKLSTLLIRLASLISDVWIRARLAVDFDEIKQELERREVIESFGVDLSSEEDFEDAKRLLENLVDVIEHAIVTEPFRLMLNHLCEQARNKVLAVSVENADAKGKMENIIHGVWLTDIDQYKGKRLLSAAIKKLPRTPFLRISLVTHFLHRVYWSHWEKDSRLALLDAAEQVLKPLHVQLDKGELKRLIGKSDKEQ